MKTDIEKAAHYSIPVPRKLLAALFRKEYPGMLFSKEDGRCLLRCLGENGKELRLDVIEPQLYMLDRWKQKAAPEPVELHEIISFCADCNFDLQEEEKAKEVPDDRWLAALKKDNDRFDRLTERMSEWEDAL